MSIIFTIVYKCEQTLKKTLRPLPRTQSALNTNRMNESLFPSLLFASWGSQEANKKKLSLRQLAYKNIPLAFNRQV